MAPYRQFSNVQNLGDKKYFPLRITHTTTDDGIRTIQRVHERFIFLTSYEETFEAEWNPENQGVPGQTNPKYNFKQTIRKVSLGFKLPARNVAEAKKNLDFCSDLANLVYGDYARVGNQEGSFVYDGANLKNKIKFGNLLRNELCYFEQFSFTPNIDAGVYEYNGSTTGVTAPGGGTPPTVGQLQEQNFQNDRGPNGLITETGYVYHNEKGKVYPREINVTLSAIIAVDTGDYLGFGGPKRSIEHQRRWAQNKNKDWPHGTGPIPVMRYMYPTQPPVLDNSEDGEDPNEAIDQFIQNELNRYY